MIAEPHYTFLTAGEVPPNLLRLQPGERVRILRPRSVLKVGYRKSAADFVHAEAVSAISGVRAEILALERALLRAAYPSETAAASIWYPQSRLHLEYDKLQWVIARALARREHLGGPERGIHMATWDQHPAELSVESTRTVQLGTYYPPSGSGEDFDSGGLSDRRSVVLVRLGPVGVEVLSGDLERVSRE